MPVEELLRRIVIGGGGEKPVARKNAARVGVGNKYRVPAGIEQNGVGSLRTDSFVGQKLRAGGCRPLGKQRAQRSGVSVLDPVGKIVQRSRFLPVKACRTNQRLQFGQ